MVENAFFVQDVLPRKVQKLNSGQFLSPAGSEGCKFQLDHGSLLISGPPGFTRLAAWGDHRQPVQEQSAQGIRRRVDAPADHYPLGECLPPSGRLTIVVIQHSAQPLAAADGSNATDACVILYDQPVAQSLVVALPMIVLNDFVEGLPQGTFPEQDHPFQAGLFDGSDEPLGVGIQIGWARQQFHGFHPSGLQSLQKLCRVQRVAVMDQVSFAHQETVRRITEVTCHLAHPEPVRLSPQSCDLHPSARRVDYEEHQKSRQASLRSSLDGEEVCRDNHLPMTGQKLLPGGLPITFGRRFQTVLLQNVGDGATRDLMA